MKKTVSLGIALLTAFLLTACGVPGAAPVPPSPTPSLTPTPEPTVTVKPTPSPTPSPSLSPSPSPSPLPSPSPAPTPSPSPASVVVSPYGDSTAVIFKDKVVEACIRKQLGKPKGSITAKDMLAVTSFKYDSINDKNAKGKIKTLNDLRYCVNLRTLWITNQPIRDIEFLRGMENLQDLNIFGCSVKSLKPLAGKKYLTTVWISGNPISDASPVLALPNLRYFNAMWGTKIKSIAALKNTRNLTSFLCQNKLDDYSPLYGHASMRSIAVSYIPDKVFRNLLGNLKKLTSIIIENSTIKDESLSLLRGFNLSSLTLNSCGIKDISALSSLTGLSDLRLRYNEITDLSALRNIPKIDYCLDIRFNHIKDYSPLKGITGRPSIWVKGNPVTDDETLRALEKNGCAVIRKY